ncbi:MAG: hypothetical protein ACHP7O_08495 [Burkholderiales bacterium]
MNSIAHEKTSSSLDYGGKRPISQNYLRSDNSLAKPPAQRDYSVDNTSCRKNIYSLEKCEGSVGLYRTALILNAVNNNH